MAGPWEKYSAPAEAGPWAKYSAQPPSPPIGPDPFAGDPLLSNEAMARIADGGSSVTPSPAPSPFRGVSRYLQGVNEAAGVINRAPSAGFGGTLEALGTLATGAVAPIPGTVDALLTGKKPEDAMARYTYQPRSESGQAQLGLLSALAKPLTDSGADAALLPMAPQSRTARVAPSAPKVKPLPIPSTDELKTAKNAAYKAAKESDVTVPPESYGEALGKIRSVTKEEGIDPDLHPKSSAVMRRLNEAEGKPLSLQEAETLRKIALDAEDDMNPVTRQPTPDARLAGKIVDELDEHVEALNVNSEARALNARFRRSDMVDRMIKRAEIRAGAHYTQAGMEHALRQEFKTLALNDRRMRWFTAEQRAAIEKVAKGGPIENGLRNLGKLDPTTGGLTGMMNLGFGGLLAGLGNPAALVPAVAGFVGRRAATQMTKRNVDSAREALVGRAPVTSPANPSASVGGGSQATRSVTEIQSELQRLEQMGQMVAPNHPVRAQIEAEKARLQRELSVASF